MTKRTHYERYGLSYKRLYGVWNRMYQRCYNIDNDDYKNYGERGIGVCDDWRNRITGFFIFYDWAMSNGYQYGLSIDRINNNGNYEPSNCRWTTARNQVNNRNETIFIEHNGIRKPFTEWCDMYRVEPNKTRNRYKKGFSFEDLFENPFVYFEKTEINRGGIVKTVKEWCDVLDIKLSIVMYRHRANWDTEKLFDPVKKIEKSNKQSGIKGIVWKRLKECWEVYGYKTDKKYVYLAMFKTLEDAIIFKEQYDKEHPYSEK